MSRPPAPAPAKAPGFEAPPDAGPPLRAPENSASQKLQDDTHYHRRDLGTALGVVAICGALWGFWAASESLLLLSTVVPENEDHAHFLISALFAKAIVAGAFFSFCYAVGRAAERFLFPYWWLVSSEDRRAAMGVKDPAPATPSSEIVKLATDTAKAAVDLAKGKKP